MRSCHQKSKFSTSCHVKNTKVYYFIPAKETSMPSSLEHVNLEISFTLNELPMLIQSYVRKGELTKPSS